MAEPPGRICLPLRAASSASTASAPRSTARARGRIEFSDSGRRSVYALAVILTVAFGVLELAFLRNDFAFNTVADTSSRTTPTFYRAAAVWSSQEGSLLLWAWLLSLWSSLALFLVRRRMRDIAAYATAILLGFGAFFISLMIFYASPFSTTNPTPAEGAGLDPLLRFPTMMIHPPMLYSGYTLCTIPLAFGMGALLARRVDADWIKAIRRFAFAAWLFLGLGILLGARWSYAELGWGGYWGWDAVENASLMPWLTGTAFLHSLMIQEKRGMLKVWNVSLVLATGTLAIMGTFLVRSGVLNSIHAFGGATLGSAVRRADRSAGRRLDLSRRLASRHAALASTGSIRCSRARRSSSANNIVLVALCFVIFWGTYFPLISEALTGTEASVGPPWFDRYTVPLALLLVLLSGIGPVIAWRRATFANARRNFAAPLLSALATLIVLLAAGIAHKPFAIAMFCCAGVRARQHRPGVLPRRARTAGDGRRGAAASHSSRSCGATGAATAATSCTSESPCCSSASPRPHPSSTPSELAPLGRRQSTHVGTYTVRYVRPTATITPKNDTVHTGSTLNIGAVLDVSKGGRHVATLSPSEGFYDSGEPAQGTVGHLIGGQAVSHISMSAGITRDVWTAIAPDISTPALQRIVSIGNRTLPADEGVVALGVLAREYLKHPPAGAVPLHRLAAGHVDLDRRADRARRRSDRDLADPERGAPPGRVALARAGRARPGTRLRRS